MFANIYNSLKRITTIHKDAMQRFVNKLNEMLNMYSPQKTDLLTESNALNNNEIKNISNDFFTLYPTLPSIRKEYINNCEIAEDVIRDFEDNKVNLELNEYPMYEEYVNIRLRIAKESENEYSRIVENINIEKEKFQNTEKSILKKMENNQKEINLMFQYTLQKLQVYVINKNEEEINYLTNESQNIGSLILSAFETNNKLYLIKSIKHVEFEPYELKILKPNKSKKSNKEKEDKLQKKVTIYNTVFTMKSQLKEIANNYNLEKESKIIEIYKLCRDILLNPISEENNQKLCEYVKESEYRLRFLLYLNNERATGKFRINKNSFMQLGHIMLYIIELISNNKDLESIRFVLILSQTYYFVNKVGEKFYLVKYIEHIEFFQSNDFWKSYFNDSISQEFEQQNINKNEQNEMEQEEKKIYDNIIFSKLLSIAHNMMVFQIDKKQIQSLVNLYIKQYNIEENLEKQITMLINDFVYDKKKLFNEEDLNEDIGEDEIKNNLINDIDEKSNEIDSTLKRDKQNENGVSLNNNEY